MLRVAVFASGTGTNLQALLDRLNTRDGAAARVALVIADRPDAGALERARLADVERRVIPVGNRAFEEVSEETLGVLEGNGIDLVALAGYVRLVPPGVVEHYRGRIVNIHPALLPAFGGKGMYGRRVHRAVLEAGCKVSGATVHQVDERYDEGRILAQWPVPVLDGDSPEVLAARVLAVEHVLYPAAVERLALDLTATGSGATRPPAAGGDQFLIGDVEALEAQVRRQLGLVKEAM